MKDLITVYRNGEEQDLDSFDVGSNLIFVDAGARAGELYPDESGPGVYFKVGEQGSLEVRRDLGKHVQSSFMPFQFEVDQVNYDSAEIHLFEPNPEFIDDLKKKAKYISQKNCIVWIYQAAVGDSEKTVKLKRTSGGWGSTTCEDKQNESFIDEIEVKQIDFLSYISSLKNRPSETAQSIHIKMDIEGSEYDVLTRLFSNWDPHCTDIKSLSVEFHRDFYKEKHDKWIAENWTGIVTLIKEGVRFNWWPGEW